MTEEEQKERYPLRGTVIRYDDPTAPVAEEDWEVLKPDASADPADRESSSLDVNGREPGVIRTNTKSA